MAVRQTSISHQAGFRRSSNCYICKVHQLLCPNAQPIVQFISLFWSFGFCQLSSLFIFCFFKNLHYLSKTKRQKYDMNVTESCFPNNAKFDIKIVLNCDILSKPCSFDTKLSTYSNKNWEQNY